MRRGRGWLRRLLFGPSAAEMYRALERIADYDVLETPTAYAAFAMRMIARQAIRWKPPEGDRRRHRRERT